MKFFLLALLVRTVFAADEKAIGADKCTAILVGRKATAFGGTMTTHSSDCADCDWRINLVPRKDWPIGSMRPIYLITGTYPRQVREDRGETWSPNNLEDMPQKPEWEKMRGNILGYIPQVAQTYQLIEGLPISFDCALIVFSNYL
jgi:dipeptidase